EPAAAPLVTTKPIRVHDSAPRKAAEPPASPATGRPTLTTKATLAPEGAQAVASLQSELAAIKRLVGQVLHCSRQTAATVAPSGAAVVAMGGMPEPLFAQYLRLQEAHVAPEIADLIVGQVRDELTQ